jgi:hypothetical protein
MIAVFPPRRSSFEIRSLIPGAFTVAAGARRSAAHIASPAASS